LSVACARIGCDKAALWQPVLLLYAPERCGPHTPARACLPLPLCDTHRDEARGNGPDALLGRGAWRRIVRGFRVAGREPPDRTRTTLTFELYTEGNA